MKFTPEVYNDPQRTSPHLQELHSSISYFYLTGDSRPAYFVDVFDILVTFLELFLLKLDSKGEI